MPAVDLPTGSSFVNAHGNELTAVASVIIALVLAQLVDTAGRLPALGDDDSAQAFVLHEADLNRTRSLLATGAVLFGRPDFRALAGTLDERSTWLLGHVLFYFWEVAAGVCSPSRKPSR